MSRPLKFGVLLGFFVAHVVVFVQKAETARKQIEAKIGIATPLRVERVVVFDIDPHAYVSFQVRDLPGLFFGDFDAQGNVGDMWKARIENGNSFFYMVVGNASEVSGMVGKHLYPALILVSSCGYDALISYPQADPAGIHISKRLGWVIGSFGDDSRPKRFHLYSHLIFNRPQRVDSDDDSANPHKTQNNVWQIFRCNQTREIALRGTFGPIVLCVGCFLLYYDDRIRSGRFWLWLFRAFGVTFISLGWGALTLPRYYTSGCNGQQDENGASHSMNIVTHKYLLTTKTYCNTLIAIGRASMANILPIEKQVAIIGALAEGSGIRQVERITAFTVTRSCGLVFVSAKAALAC